MARRKEGRHDDSDWGLFLGAAGAVDGKRVMERLLADIGNLERNPQGEFHYIIRTWVPADRAGALEWLESLPKGLFRDGLWSGYLGGLAEVDLAASIKGVEDMPADVRHHFLWDLAPRVFAQGGLEGADAWLKTVIATNADGSQANQSHVRQVFGLVARRVVETNETSGQPLASIQWLASHANQPYFSQSTWGSAVAAGVRADPAGAMQQFTSLTGNLQNSALNTGMNTWAVADLPAAERWLADRQEAPFYDAAAMGLITHLMKTNAPAAVKWIDSLADPTVRANLRRQVP